MKRAVQLQTDPSIALSSVPLDFEGFFAEHRSGLFGALWLVSRNRHEAEELTQDAFVKVWERWDRVRQLEDRDAIVRALGRLTPAQRAALVLIDLVGLTSEEAGRALGVRPSTVRVLAARGRTMLRQLIGDLDG